MPAESRPSFPVPLFLKISGIVLILGIGADYLTLAFPPNFLNYEWLANLIDQFVGRGAVPLLGIALLFWGMGMDGSIDRGARQWATPAVLLAMGLGLMFLLFTPLYFNSNRLISTASSQDLNVQAERAVQQMNQQLAMREGQVKVLLNNSDQVAALDADLQNEQINTADRAQLRKIKETLDRIQGDPKLLETEVAKARTDGVKQIKEQQEQAKARLQVEMRRSQLRITSISLVLAVGYFRVGHAGWKMMQLNAAHPSAKKARARKSSRQKRLDKGNV